MTTSSYESIIKKNYQNKLENERETKGLTDTVIVPYGQESIKLLPISNLFYGNDECPPRLKLLDEHIKRVNDMEDGAFFLGGNLFYYPAGDTDEKAELAEMYIEHLTKILERADKDKILLIYDGVNEKKFKDDRKLKHEIDTTEVLAKNLGLSDRYYADTKVELNFVFNNELTGKEDKFMAGLFTSLGPISATKNAVMTKIKNNFLLNAEKTFSIDTSSSLFATKKKIVNMSEDPLISRYRDANWISCAGYTDMPQIAKKSNLYTVNQRLIELTIRPKNLELNPSSTRDSNTIKNDDWDRLALCLTIGVNHEKYFDPKVFEELNISLMKNLMIKEDLLSKIEKKISIKQQYEEAAIMEEFYKSLENTPEKIDKKPETSKYMFE